MSKYLIILVPLLALIVAYALQFAINGFPILSGFSSKIVCSNHFINKRSVQDIVKEDVLNPFARLVTAKESTDSVTACVNIFGYPVTCQTSYYTEGIGCTRGGRPNFDTSLVKTYKNNNNAQHKVNINANVQKYLDSIVNGNYPGNTTRQIVVIHKGSIVGEAYDSRYPKDMPLLGWSMTKSVTNALIGILVQKGVLNVNDIAYKGTNITIDNLLKMNSGIEFDEDYTQASDVTKMLYQEYDMVQYYDTLPKTRPPGHKWYYSSGSTNKLSKIVKESVGGTLNDYYKFVKTELFNKLGMNAIMEPDESGTFVGSSYMFATARDWSVFGQLFLNNGLWNGEQILPPTWSQYSSSPAPGSEGKYGAQFYLIPHYSKGVFPKGTFFCMGYTGQTIIMSPEHELVVVKISLKDPKDVIDVFNENLYLSLKTILNIQ